MLSIFLNLLASKEAILLVPYFVSDPSPYGANLNQLFELLHTKVPPTGFGHGSIGQGTDQVNGLALCRGYVNATNCMSCVV